MQNQSVFERLSAINLNGKVEKKDNLSYLSWSWAWSEVKKAYPSAIYKVLPMQEDDDLGFMCHTEVTIEGETLEMWLPVMDGKNKAMKRQPYTYTTKYGEKTVEAATMFDINKTQMRCLVKNLAMFGLGIYIYAGEDLPEGEATPIVPATTAKGSAKAPTNDAPAGLLVLKVGDANWEKVSKYVLDNKDMGTDKLVQQLSRKYSISPATKKHIDGLVKS